jgi:hypothetical protein
VLRDAGRQPSGPRADLFDLVPRLLESPPIPSDIFKPVHYVGAT